MIKINKKLFFRTASIVLEDNKIFEFINSGKYSSVVALSYNKLDIPNSSLYSKPTLLIDLTKQENEIFQTFNDTTRNEIRRTEKSDSLFFSECKEIDRYSYDLYKDFEYSQGRVPVAFSELKETIFFGAYFENKLVSGICVSKSEPYLRIRSIFSKRTKTRDKELYKIIGYSTRRLVWNICLWGKKNKFISLDMASVNINNPRTESIAKFKMSFGKELTPEYTYIFKTKTFTFFEKIVFIKLIFKKIVHRFFI